MRRRITSALFCTLPLALVLIVASCASDSPAPADSPAQGAVDNTDAPADPPNRTPVSLVDSGFGQRGEYVQGIAIVELSDDLGVGEFATVSMNFLDESGGILATEEQVEQFYWSGQQLILPVWLDLTDEPGAAVVSVDASISLSKHGGLATAKSPLPTLDSKTISGDGDWDQTATFEFTNETDSDLEDARIGVVCYDSDNKIIGGGHAYPELIARGTTVKIDSTILTTGDPESCKAFPNYGL